MNSKHLAKWEQTRTKGIGRFVLLNAVLFGCALIIGTSVFDYFFSHRDFRFEYLYIKAPVYMVSGFIFGLLMWFVGERQYHKNVRQHPPLKEKTEI